MDEEVHGFVSDSLPPLTEWEHTKTPFIPNGSDASAHEGAAFAAKKHHKKHNKKNHKRPDVAERGMDEEVHGFVSDSLPPLTEWEHTKTPFIPNGSDASAHEGAAFSERKHHRKHHKRPDVAERGMDEEVHGFVTDSLPPLNTRVRSTMPFVPNGSDPSAHSPNFLTKRPDVAERGMDEEVHGFVVDSLPPLNTRVRSTMPFVPNGSDPSAHSPSFTQGRRHHKHSHRRPDVAERGMDEEVHGFVVDSLPPLNTRVRSTMPFIPNGSDPSAHSPNFMSHGKRDIAERGMDSDVWGFSSEAIPPMTTKERSPMPFIPNGS
jgi:hypothetical protein